LADDKDRIGTSKIQVQSSKLLGFPAQWCSKQREELAHTYPDPYGAFLSRVVFQILQSKPMSAAGDCNSTPFLLFGHSLNSVNFTYMVI